MTILAIDPGKNIGYALFEDDGTEIERGIIDFDDWFRGYNLWLRDNEDGVGDRLFFRDYEEVTLLICEDFTHDPNIRQGGSKHEAAQIIGSVKTYTSMVALTPLTMQPASALSVAMMITGYEKPVTKTGNKKHLPDQDSAWLHGRYWLHANEVL